MNIRKFLIENEINWTSKYLNNFLSDNYPKIQDRKYLIFDHYFYIDSNEESQVLSFLERFANKNKTYPYVFLLNKYDKEVYKSMNLFLEDLYKNLNFSNNIDKKNFLLIAYSDEDKEFGIYSGENLRDILTLNKMYEISNKASALTKVFCVEGLLYSVVEIEASLKILTYWSPSDIRNYVEEYLENPLYLLFDPHKNLNGDEYNGLVKMIFNLSRNDVYSFSFIMSDITNKNENSKDMEEYINKVAEKYPIDSSIKKKINIFIVYCTKSKEINILVLNDNKNKFKDKKEKIIDEASVLLQKSIYDGFNLTFERIKKIFGNDKSNYKNSTWKIATYSLSGVVVLIIILFLLTRMVKKYHSAEIEQKNNMMEDNNKTKALNLNDTSSPE